MPATLVVCTPMGLSTARGVGHGILGLPHTTLAVRQAIVVPHCQLICCHSGGPAHTAQLLNGVRWAAARVFLPNTALSLVLFFLHCFFFALLLTIACFCFFLISCFPPFSQPVKVVRARASAAGCAEVAVARLELEKGRFEACRAALDRWERCAAGTTACKARYRSGGRRTREEGQPHGEILGYICSFP